MSSALGVETGRAPMRLFICKIASRCNLDCDYCYVYRHADQSWREQPRRMSLAAAAKLGFRIAEHSATHSLEAVDVVLHGGEPLLAGVEYLDHWCRTLTEAARPIRVRFRMQTNGTLFDEKALAFARRWDVKIGLSIDGGVGANDRHRVDFQGRSSFTAADRAVRLLASEARDLWSGFLTVIDLQNDPLEVYSYLRAYSPRSIEFLLPLGNYDLRPPGKEATLTTTPYADWLLAIFEQWWTESPQTIRIRRFRDIIALLAGVDNSSEEWGLQPVDFAVIETNGEIQAVDTLKITFPGASHLGLNIFDNALDAMYASPHVLERQERWAALSDTCQRCDVVQVCGGGYFPHRYSKENGFRNPSIYCTDIEKLIRQVHRAALTTLSHAARRGGATTA